MFKPKQIYISITIILLIPVLILNQFLPQVMAETTCEGVFQSVSLPLTELGSNEYVRFNGEASGVTGGLYPDGSNTPPPAHQEAGLAAAAAVKRLDAEGLPDSENGRIVMVTLGMSNTDQESRAFVQQVRDDKNAAESTINPNLFVINGGKPGESADKWADPESINWEILNQKIVDIRYGGQPDLTPAQVQVAWVKQAHRMMTRTTAFPDHVTDLQTDLEQIVRNLKVQYPNLQMVFFSSRSRSYGYWNGVDETWGLLSPEPAAFESGFAVKWMLEKQINGDLSLNFDPALGEVVAPYLAWGPYIWVNESPRADGFEWTQADLEHDCTHPSASGEAKVAAALENFFKTDASAVTWFTDGADVPPPTPTLTAVPTETALPATPTITATAIVSATATPTAVPATQTPTAIPPTATPTAAAGSSLHVGNLDGSSNASAPGWEAEVIISVHDNNEGLMSDVLVEGTWFFGARTSAGSCVTDGAGMCVVTLTSIPNFVNEVVFVVDDLIGNLTYDPGTNHDPDASSDGNQIIINK